MEDVDEDGFDLCEECEARMPSGGIAFLSQDAAIAFLESCPVCSANLAAMIRPPPLIGGVRNIFQE